jgi:sugar O-acyltransferase (sialic acid O-acetyltransferase NeuD family)
VRLGVYGAGGFGREVVDVARRVNAASPRWSGMFFIDDFAQEGEHRGGLPVFPLRGVVAALAGEPAEIVIAVGDPTPRAKMHDKVMEAGLPLATLSDPLAIVSPSATLEPGAIITAYCFVGPDARIGRNSVLNLQALAGHDVVVGDHCVIGSMVNLGGALTIGARTYVGMGTQVREKLSIGSDAIIGMGSVVHDDIPDEVIAMGNPARVLRKNVDRKVFR